ncbi:hypothetical protein [Croceiramulus getboli]|nr:hypothetical protein P8624_03405 [Flavobacteriaceae bacterium YJPT1-3]
MKHLTLHLKSVFFLVTLLYLSFASAQVGIGTTTPEASAILDINSTSQGLLPPRMTTAQRNAIVSPAPGLVVYDSDEGVHYAYSGSSWNAMSAGARRSNYVLVQSEADFPAPVGGKITLDEATLYEINGLVTVSNYIDLNGAKIEGRDAQEDIIVNNSGSTLFQGKGGTIIRTTLVGNGQTIFNVSGSQGPTDNFILTDTFLSGASAVGSFTSMSLVFMDTISYLNNSDGIALNNIITVIFTSQLWQNSNTGTYLDLAGTFETFELSTGYVGVNSGEVGIDVSANPTIGSHANISNVGFNILPGGLGVNPYTAGEIYNGYNFSSSWNVDTDGLIVESDQSAFGNIYISTSSPTTFSSAGETKKVSGTTTSVANFRTDTNSANNRIVYEGSKSRRFFISASCTVDADNKKVFTFYVAKNGVILPSTGIPTNVVGNSDIRSLAFTGTVQLDEGDYIEIWAQSANASTTLEVEAMNLLIY